MALLIPVHRHHITLGVPYVPIKLIGLTTSHNILTDPIAIGIIVIVF
ncbi:MAG TPA: hypothetical protein VNS32_23235 [Flavisolibacter sp.]|nr:hypothetical protein [Flavisolibacter sp.]